MNRYMLLFLVFLMSSAYAENGKYIVYFRDKPSFTHPEQLFSEKALEKRKKYQIGFDERDFPVYALYLKQLGEMQITVLNTSNWLNAVLVRADEKDIRQLQQTAFVSAIVKVGQNGKGGVSATQDLNDCTDVNDVLEYEDNYTVSFPQFHLLNAEYLHEQGFNGEGMTVAVCDNGFLNVKTNPSFSHIFSENRMLGTYDYVNGDSAVYDQGGHGASCLSFISGIKDNQYIGTSVKSSFYLFHTENDAGERLQEEFNLATALERCSQLGVDVVSISLGYTTFDVTSENHDTSDMKKNITPAARAVNMASSKGLLVCVAAGNEGTGAWKYISSPADADSAFAVASVDVNGVVAASSGYGLATDMRVKPNVAAAGQGVRYINPSNQLATGSGTSFACPSLAGMSACLWQAFPSRTNWEIKTAIEQSASQYLTPDKRIGYGIPDFKKAFQMLNAATFVSSKSLEHDYMVYPNPFQQTVTISNQGASVIQQVQLVNAIGQTVYADNTPSSHTIALDNVPKGIYLLQLTTSQGIVIKKLMKD